jgi:hypothetical protein
MKKPDSDRKTLMRRYDLWSDSRFIDYHGTGALSCARCGVLLGDPELHWSSQHAGTESA